MFLCTGALIADQGQTGTPYLLTANHCFDNQASATSLTAYFDYRTDACNGTTPSLSSVPSVPGATLLATGVESDFTLVQLSALPSGTNHFLGWTATRPSEGAVLHRVSHSAGLPQHYDSSVYFGAVGGVGCTQLPRDQFHYSTRLEGSNTGGSSGGPTVLDQNGGQIVGQINGICFLGAFDDCVADSFDQMDGSFEWTAQQVTPWLGTEPGASIFADGFESGDTSSW